MRPLYGGKICTIDELERRLDHVIRVLEPRLPEEVGGFDDSRGEYVKPAAAVSDTS